MVASRCGAPLRAAFPPSWWRASPPGSSTRQHRRPACSRRGSYLDTYGDDRVNWGEITGCVDAFRTIAPTKLIAELDQG